MKSFESNLDRLEDLAALAKVLRDVDPDLIQEITLAERQRIASLIELREGPGRFLWLTTKKRLHVINGLGRWTLMFIAPLLKQKRKNASIKKRQDWQL